MEESRYMGNITMEQEHTESRIVDSSNGRKMIIPVRNASVPAFWADKALKTAEVFLNVHAAVYGWMPEGIYVDGSLTACLGRNVPAGQKYRLSIVVVTEDGSGPGAQDYIIDIPILPADMHFPEFRQCFMDEFEAMLGNMQDMGITDVKELKEAGIWKTG